MDEQRSPKPPVAGSSPAGPAIPLYLESFRYLAAGKSPAYTANAIRKLALAHPEGLILPAIAPWTYDEAKATWLLLNGQIRRRVTILVDSSTPSTVGFLTDHQSAGEGERLMPIAMPPTVVRHLAELLPVEYNPRTISERQTEKLGGSLAEFGYVQHIVVNTAPGRENRIVGGEQRWRQLMAAGETEAPCVEVCIAELEREKKLNIILNRVGGQWDMEKLASEFDAGELIEWGFERFDFKDLPAEDLKLEGAGDGASPRPAPAAAPAAAGAPLPVSPVRMVQLFFNQEDFLAFTAIVERWRPKLEKNSVTDTVLAILRDFDVEGEEPPHIGQAPALEAASWPLTPLSPVQREDLAATPGPYPLETLTPPPPPRRRGPKIGPMPEPA